MCFGRIKLQGHIFPSKDSLLLPFKLINMKYFYFVLVLFLFSACFQGEKVDLIIHKGRIHIMNDALTVVEAMAIKDGKIIEVGPERQILNKYRADKVIDAKWKDIYPGFHDAHGHIFSLVNQRLNADLRKAASYYQMISILEKHHAKLKQKIIIGRGWDHSLWGETKLPNNKLLNEAFPDIPVALTRVDGHAMLINQAMMDLVGITEETTIDGGVIMADTAGLTGILLDNALYLVNNNLPEPSKEIIKEKILEIQEDFLSLGLTHIHEAGITEIERDILIELANENKLKINIYAMLFPTEDNIAFAEREGFYRNKHLSIRSFKVVEDGALGSHGACMLQPYTDAPYEHGILLNTPTELANIFKMAKELRYQVNTHCIGDSANRIVLNMIDTLMRDQKDHRWRIEHAQVIHPNDFQLFPAAGVIPSVQPTHATSDQRWAEHHIGKERLEGGAYAYKTLQETFGLVIFGTDFPIEDYDPFATIYAATQRKDLSGEPLNGFLPNEAVSFDVALKAMTSWAAIGCFEENTVGTLEAGKIANLVILDNPLKNTNRFMPNYAWKTIVDGKIIFEID